MTKISPLGHVGHIIQAVIMVIAFAQFWVSISISYTSTLQWALLGNCVERTPLQKGHKFLAASTMNVYNAPSHQRTPL